ncbi:MAG: sterol desaturase family protein [Bacteriovoracaceae bacterium]|nr:sterol desaturase family protein [Bacteriovoracaceae bacterium]
MSNLLIRVYVFVAVALILILLEFFFAYRRRNLSRFSRWPSNIALVAIDNFLVKLLLPAGLMSIAIWANTNNVGIFNFFKFNYLVSAVLTFVVFDFTIYFQHVYSHKWNFLWIFHKVHHTDPDLDVTSALRFHPVEILYSLGYKIVIVLLVGANPFSILVFEVVLNSMAMFNHANLYIPPKFEKVLRFVFVTPQMHIIHHSIEKNESDTNFGFNFSIWDYMFKTYRIKFSSAGIIGQRDHENSKDQQILTLILQPFQK